ncbi:MAG: glucosylceramidase [Lachnospiraceae bacterium]|nr:glucosylceramidase [Lachnospiraceae bacterium]
MKCYVTNELQHMKEMQISLEKRDGGEMQLVKVYPSVSYQEILGMGGAFTEASAYTYSQMSEEKQKELISLYFGENGNNYNFCRTHIQSCDFALGNYAYVEDETDRDLESFSIENDRKYLLPLIKAAMNEKEDIKLLASPWSPPAFMKTNGEMNHGGKLKEDYRGMWADMIARYIDEYEKEGVKISRLTIQNEPAATQTWDSCLFSGTEEAEFAANFLRPALDKAGHTDVKISIWDHNKEKMLDRAEESFRVNNADSAIDGIAFHWYTGDHFEALQETGKQFPNKELIFTEGCVEYSRFAGDNQVAHAEMYAHDIIGNFKAGMNGFIDWNLILDEKGGPNHVGNFCDAPIMCKTKEDLIDVKLSYYYIGHFSRFIQPGAKRILASSFSRHLEAVAFVNPDGEKVLVILNTSDEEMKFTITDTVLSGEVSIKGHSIMTLCW